MKEELIRKLFFECGVMNGAKEQFDKLKHLEIFCIEQEKKIKQLEKEIIEVRDASFEAGKEEAYRQDENEQ